MFYFFGTSYALYSSLLMVLVCRVHGTWNNTFAFLLHLSEISAQFPCVYLDTLSPYITGIITQTLTSARTHILTNPLTSIPSSCIEYATLPLSSLAVYTQLLTALLLVLPIHTFDPRCSASNAELISCDVDDDDPTPGTAIPQPGSPVLDAKTQKKLQTLPSPSHLHTLLKPTQQHR